MKHSIIVLLYIICSLVGVNAQTPATYTVRGYVKDACGLPVQNSHLTIESRKAWRKYAAFVNAQGYFQLPNVAAGKYKITTWSNRYNVQNIDSITVGDHSLHNVEITMACMGYVMPIPQEPAYLLSCQLKRIPDRNNVFCGMGTGAVQRGDEVSLYGSRDNGYLLYIDGVKMRHTQWVPQASIQEVDIWTMSIPANLDVSP